MTSFASTSSLQDHAFSLTRFELTCGSSRLWGGVHFVDAVEEGNRIGNEIGKIATEFVRRHINPKNPPQGPVVGPLARGPKSQPLRAAPTRAAPAAAPAPTGMVANDFLYILPFWAQIHHYHS